MKATILERRGEWVAALREDGIVVKTRQPGEVGDTIEVSAEFAVRHEPSRPRRHHGIGAAIAIVLALVIAGGGAVWYTTAQAASFVSVDVGDASVELLVNRLGRVIEVKSLNEDSEELARSLTARVQKKTMEDAIGITVKRLRNKGYLDNGEDFIVGVAPENEQKGEVMTQAVERSVEKNREETDTFYVFTGDKIDRDEAQKHDQSVGKFCAEQEFNCKLEEIYGKEVFGENADLSDMEQAHPELTPPAWMEEWVAQRGYRTGAQDPVAAASEQTTPEVEASVEKNGDTEVTPPPAESVQPVETPQPTPKPTPTPSPAQTKKPATESRKPAQKSTSPKQSQTSGNTPKAQTTPKPVPSATTPKPSQSAPVTSQRSASPSPTPDADLVMPPESSPSLSAAPAATPQPTTAPEVKATPVATPTPAVPPAAAPGVLEPGGGAIQLGGGGN